MTTNTRASSISEDWEELCYGESIYDDTASILSLSTNETHDSSHEAASEDDTREADDSLPMRGRVPASTNPTQDDDADSISSIETITGDLLDIVIEPSILLSTLDSLQSTLSESITLCADPNNTTGNGAFLGVSEALHQLLGTIIDLKEMASCYVRLWNPNDPSSRTPPIDPTLYKWCTDCAVELYKLQADLETQSAKIIHSLNWAGYTDRVNKFCQDISVFLPIMRVDLDEYQTPRLDFPSYTTSQQTPPHHDFLHRRYRGPDPEEVVSGPIPALRQQLYALKDEIGKTNSIINDCKVTRVFSKDDETKLCQIQNMQTCTFRALGMILSNHGSDWIDQTLAGGLSYAEFTCLTPHRIQSFERRFWNFGRLLDNLRWSLSYSISDEDQEIPQLGLSFSEQRYEKSSSHDTQINTLGNNVAMIFSIEDMRAMIEELNILLKVKAEEDN